MRISNLFLNKNPKYAGPFDVFYDFTAKKIFAVKETTWAFPRVKPQGVSETNSAIKFALRMQLVSQQVSVL